MSKRLSADVVLQRTKAGTLENVKNLNLWGNEISDVSLLEQMPNLEVVSLSVNKISSLKSFSHCSKLKEIYLRKNNIENLGELKFLVNLPNLSVLWLWDNPCAEHPNYRAQTISTLPKLVKLDNQPITPEERAASHKAPPREILAEIPRDDIPSKEVPPRDNRHVKKEKPRENPPRNDNILCAVLALIKELDTTGLEMVARDIDRKLNK